MSIYILIDPVESWPNVLRREGNRSRCNKKGSHSDKQKKRFILAGYLHLLHVYLPDIFGGLCLFLFCWWPVFTASNVNLLSLVHFFSLSHTIFLLTIQPKVKPTKASLHIIVDPRSEAVFTLPSEIKFMLTHFGLLRSKLSASLVATQVFTTAHGMRVR